MRQIYVDMDGVLADFDALAIDVVGSPDPRQAEATLGSREFWRRLAAVPAFYRRLPKMADADVLWAGVVAASPTPPIILTGVPTSIPSAPAEKIAWAAEHFPGAAVLTCASRNKSQYCQPGDVLIDDWAKYRALWEGVGGHFILHVSAADSLAALEALGHGPQAPA
jgi:hypothetical protein